MTISTDDVHGNEYIHSCVKLRYFKRFMASCPMDTKQHIFCDVLFSSYMGMLGKKDVGLTSRFAPKQDDWMYFYRIGHQDSVCEKLDKTLNIQTISRNWDWIFATRCGEQISSDELTKHANKMIKDKRASSLIQMALQHSKLTSVFSPSNLKKLLESTYYL
jgi:hypothetical protein